MWNCLVSDGKLQWSVVTGSPPYIPRPEEVTSTHQAPAPSSSTPETASRIIQEVGGTKEHTRVINPTLIAHFEFSSKSSPLQPPQ